MPDTTAPATAEELRTLAPQYQARGWCVTAAKLIALADQLDRERQPTHRHFKGGLYRVLHDDAKNDDLEPMTVYQSVEDGNVWVRTTANFRYVFPDGRKRFEPLPAPPAEGNR
jgi:hypothetical protein